MSLLPDAARTIYEHALDGLTLRQQAISSNLTNIDTPGYAPETVDFESALRREVETAASMPGNAASPSFGPSADVALLRTDPRHLGLSGQSGPDSGAAISSGAETLRNDQNQVDVESEMTALTETQIKYEAVSRMLSGKFASLETVIGGR